jgi:pimeloyl-ACP methyl ester carboxylesterase
MNEESSKFVDKLAMEKLINEKLAKVRHSPDNSYFSDRNISYEGINEISLLKSEITLVETAKGVSLFHIPSFFKQEFYMENNTIPVYLYPSPEAKGNLLIVHGLFDDNMVNFLFLITQLCSLNFNVFFMVLPYHFSRKPGESFFGGEYFFSGDLYRTRNAFKQAVLDVEAAIQLINFHNSMPANILGFSMGGCVAFQYYLLKKGKIKTFLLNPVTEFKRLAWDNNLLLSIGRDLEESALREEEILKVFGDLDPCEKIGLDFSADNLAIGCSAFDQVIGKRKYDSFIRRTQIKNVVEYSAGHLNVLRVPRLARDIQRFLNDYLCTDESQNTSNN